MPGSARRSVWNCRWSRRNRASGPCSAAKRRARLYSPNDAPLDRSPQRYRSEADTPCAQHVQSVTVPEPPSRRAPGTVYAPAPRVTGLVELLDRLDRAVEAALSPATTAEGVNRDGWRVLLMLARGGGRSMGEIASHTALPAPTATRVVDRLVDARLAYRHTDPGDRRRVLVHLAADGRELVERVCRRVERSAATLLGGTHTPERERLAELLAALATTP